MRRHCQCFGCQFHSDLCFRATPVVSSYCEFVGEFAGDALATLEDWETELTLEDLNAGHTKIH